MLLQGAVQERCFNLKLAVKKLRGSTARDHDREPPANALWGFQGATGRTTESVV